MKNPHRAVCLAIVLSTSVGPTMLASAQQQPTTVASTVENWTNPGSFPFKGKFDDVCNLYKATLTNEQCLRAIDSHERGGGTEIFLQDGDILQISFTVNGVHKQKTLRVAFGAHVPANDPMRRAMVYDTGRPDGVKLVRPDVCGNWSVMTLPNPSPPPPAPVIVTRLVERPIEICEMPGATTIINPSIYVPGFGHPEGCGCGLHYPGLFVPGEILPTRGSPICYTINPEKGD